MGTRSCCKTKQKPASDVPNRKGKAKRIGDTEYRGFFSIVKRRVSAFLVARGRTKRLRAMVEFIKYLGVESS